MLKLFRLLSPYRGYVAIVLVLALAQSIGTLLLPRLMSDIVDKGIVKGDQRAILQTGGLMLLMSMVATSAPSPGVTTRRRSRPGSAGFCAEPSSRAWSAFRSTSSTASARRRW